MEWVGWFWIIIGCVCPFFSCFLYPDKVKKLEKEVKKIKGNKKGEYSMSNIISKLVGEKCTITTEEVLFSGNGECDCDVLEVDEEWVKVSYCDKKGNSKIKILRIENIVDIEISM